MKQLFNRVNNYKKKRRNKNEYIETREVDTRHDFELGYFDEIEIRIDEWIIEKGHGRRAQKRQKWTVKIPKTQHDQKPADELVKKFIDHAVKYREENSKTRISGGHEKNRRYFDTVLMDFVKAYDEDFLNTNYQPVKEGSK